MCIERKPQNDRYVLLVNEPVFRTATAAYGDRIDPLGKTVGFFLLLFVCPARAIFSGPKNDPKL